MKVTIDKRVDPIDETSSRNHSKANARIRSSSHQPTLQGNKFKETAAPSGLTNFALEQHNNQNNVTYQMGDSLSFKARSENASQNYLASQNSLTGSIGSAMKKKVKQEYNLQVKSQRQLQIEVEQHSKKEQALLVEREAKEKVLAQIETEL